ncbi:MAG TPA: MBG domain-containing protein, partial [Geomonas sp.]|nr:MBG domain-containing protein [Geomonas sp.]
VTPAAASKTYGAADPALTGTLSGFIAADNVTATYSRAAGENVTGGPYAISATLAPPGVLGNYNITYNTANFTITKADETLIVPALPDMTYGDPPYSLNATASSGLPVELTIVSGPATISGNVITPAGAGVVTVKASQPGNGNFNKATDVIQTFNVLVPTPGVPTGGSVCGTFILTWNRSALPGVTYVLEYSNDGSTWTKAYSGLQNSMAFTQIPNGPYTFRVKAVSGEQSSIYAVGQGFTVIQDLSAPGAPYSSAPGSETTGTFTMTWGRSHLAGSTYILQYSNDGINWVQVYSGQNTWTSINQLPNGTYTFRVQAVNGNQTTEWVTGSTFTVAQDLSAPGVPIGSDAGGTFTLSWGPSHLASAGYVLEYSNNGTDWTTAYNGTDRFKYFTQIPNGSYTFRVKATNGDASSPYTYGAPFTVTQNLTPPGIPSATVAGSETTGTFTLSWTRSHLAGATYVVQYTKDGINWIQAYTGQDFWCSFSQLPNGPYTFRVRAFSGGQTTDWVTGFTFTVKQDLSAPGAPTGNDPSGTFTLSWGPSHLTLASYTLEYSTNGTDWTTAYTGPNRFMYFAQLPNGNYTFRVKAVNGADSSTYSTGATFTVHQDLSAPGVPYVSAPGSSTSGTFTLTWQRSHLAGATYVLDYSTDGKSWTNAYTGQNYWNSFTGLGNGQYTFRVKAMSGDQSSAYSSTALLVNH